MAKIWLWVFLLLFLSGCKIPNTIPLLGDEKEADKFARHFFENLVAGKVDSCYNDLSEVRQTEKWRSIIKNGAGILRGRKIMQYTLIENSISHSLIGGDKYYMYTLGYQVEMDLNGIPDYMYYQASVKEEGGKLYISFFNGDRLKKPLQEENKFSLNDFGFLQFLMLVFMFLAVGFCVSTWVILLISDVTKRNKIIWSFLILFVHVERFSLVWKSGKPGYSFLYFNIFPALFYRWSQFAPWVFQFSIPLGAILFWVNRKTLILNQEDYKKPVLPTTSVIKPEKIVMAETVKIDAAKEDHSRFMPPGYKPPETEP